MSENMICRFCVSQSRIQKWSYHRSGFGIIGASPHYAPDRPFKIEHIRLDLSVQPQSKIISGSVLQKVRVVAANQTVMRLDQVGLKIEAVQVNQKSNDFSIHGNCLNIHFSQSPGVGELLEVLIRYSVSQPKRGIYFTGPDENYPGKRFQVWTQGQDEDSRYWFPTLDYPNQKSTSEVIATVPKGYTAISNGALISKDETKDGTRFHYQLGVPHVTYLITLVVAELTEWTDKGPRNIPIQYYVAPGREADGKRAFGNTPQMLEVFEKKTGIPYPFEKYSQVAVQDFIFGGMENTSATTQTDLTLHDERAHLDFSSDPLVSHELAHQWFGNLVTCKDWSHGWLNEGFATFLERVWVEANPGPGGGFEEAKYYSYQDWKEYLEEDQGRYRRPIVCNTYIEPIDLFDRHLYQKGGLVLNLLRHVLGDHSFWKSVELYLNRHQKQNVETLDLIRAIEDTTGRNLRRFFDEWVFNAGYPEFEVSYQWHEEQKQTEWIIEQKQTKGAPSVTEDGATTLLFHLPVTLELTLQDGQRVTHTLDLQEARERIFIPCSRKPKMVRFDPNSWIPKTLKFPRPKEMLLEQLENDPDCMGRIEAAQELSKLTDAEVISKLGKCLQKDRFWGVQVEIAKVLAGVREDAARDQLIAALQVEHPKARRAIVNALGTFKDQKSSQALKKFADQDPSYFVEAEAIQSYVKSHLTPYLTSNSNEVNRLEEFALSQLKKLSYRDVISSAALSSLAELPGVAQGERPRVVQSLIEWAQPGKSQEARLGAVRALGKIFAKSRAPERALLLKVFEDLSDEDNFRLRVQLVGSLQESGCSEVIPILNKIRRLDYDGRVKRGAQEAVDYLMKSQEMPESIQQLRSALEKLEEEHRKLKTLVENSRVGIK